MDQRETKRGPEMFEEWLTEMLNVAKIDEEFIAREAYKLGLQRGYDSAVDTVLYTEVSKELSKLNEEDENEEKEAK